MSTPSSGSMDETADWATTTPESWTDFFGGIPRVTIARLRDRKLDPEGRAQVRLGAHTDAAAVGACDRGDDRETEADTAARTGSRGVGAVEALEHAGELVVGQSRAAVPHLDHGASVLARHTDAGQRSG